MTAKHRTRHLVVAADEPSDEIPAGHGLVVQIFPPARGICLCCKKRRERLARDGRRCDSCVATCGKYQHNDQEESSA